jgi:hypothetical protein
MGALEQGRLQSGIDLSPQYYQALEDLMRNQGVSLIEGGGAMTDAVMRDMSQRAQGPGRELAGSLLATQQAVDPRFYEQQGNLSNLMSQVVQQLSPEGDREEMARGLAALGLNPNSAINTAEGAMHFGQAGRQRQLEFANLMSSVSQMLPLMRSGIDATALTLGVQNPGLTAFTGLRLPDNTSADLASNMQNSLFNLEGLYEQLGASKHQSTLDKIQQGAQIGESLASSATSIAGIAMMCHIARLVIPERWVEFYVWKELEGPVWFRQWYNRNSVRVADALKDKPALIKIVRNKMLDILKG